MAEELKGMKAVLSADITDFKKKMAEVNRSLGETDKQFRKSFGNIAKASKEYGLAMLATGTAIVGATVAAAKAFAEEGEELLRLKERTGLSVDALSEYKYALGTADVSMDSFATSVKNLQGNFYDAVNGSKAAQAALSGLGLSYRDLQGLAPEEQLDKVVKALAAIPDPATRSAVAVNVLGRNATDLLPLIDNLDALRQKARDLGVVMSEETAEKAGELSDKLNDMQVALNNLKNAVGEAAAPVITDLANDLTGLVGDLTDFIKQNPGVVEAALKTGAALMGIGGALAAIGKVLPAVLKGLAAIGTVLGATSPQVLLLLAGLSMIVYGLSKYYGIQQENEERLRLNASLQDAWNKVMAEGNQPTREAAEAYIAAAEAQLEHMRAVGLDTEANRAAMEGLQANIDRYKAYIAALDEWNAALAASAAPLEKLNAQLGEINASLDAEREKLNLGLPNKYVETLTAAVDEYKLAISQAVGGWDKVDEATKAEIQNMYDLAKVTQEYLDQVEAIKNAVSSWNKYNQSQYASAWTSQGLTTEKMLQYLAQKWGMSIFEVQTRLASLGITSDIEDIINHFADLGVDSKDLARYLTELAQAEQEAGDAATRAAAQMQNAMASLYGAAAALNRACGGAGTGLTNLFENWFGPAWGETNPYTPPGGIEGRQPTDLAYWYAELERAMKMLTYMNQQAISNPALNSDPAWRKAYEDLIKSIDRIQRIIAALERGENPFGPNGELPGMATGGVVTRAGMVRVGEIGPELLSLPTGAAVAPLPATGLGGRFNITLEIDGQTLAQIDDENLGQRRTARRW